MWSCPWSGPLVRGVRHMRSSLDTHFSDCEGCLPICSLRSCFLRMMDRITSQNFASLTVVSSILSARNFLRSIANCLWWALRSNIAWIEPWVRFHTLTIFILLLNIFCVSGSTSFLEYQTFTYELARTMQPRPRLSTTICYLWSATSAVWGIRYRGRPSSIVFCFLRRSFSRPVSLLTQHPHLQTWKYNHRCYAGEKKRQTRFGVVLGLLQLRNPRWNVNFNCCGLSWLRSYPL